MQVRRRAGRRDQRQIDLGPLQLGLHLAVDYRYQRHADTGRLPLERRQERHGDRAQGVIGGGDPDRHAGTGRIERPCLQHRVDLGQHPFHGLRQVQRPLRRHDAALGAHEQGIVKTFAQAHQYAAQRRLRQRQPVGGARDVALIEQHIERFEQIEVELAQVVHQEARRQHRLRMVPNA